MAVYLIRVQTLDVGVSILIAEVWQKCLNSNSWFNIKHNTSVLLNARFLSRSVSHYFKKHLLFVCVFSSRVKNLRRRPTRWSKRKDGRTRRWRCCSSASAWWSRSSSLDSLSLPASEGSSLFQMGGRIKKAERLEADEDERSRRSCGTLLSLLTCSGCGLSVF